MPSAATIKQGPKLAEYGVKDPDAEWGDYVLLRPWDEQKFLASLRSAENTPRSQLKPDGNRAIIYCSTTDPYQVIRHPDPARQRELAAHARFLVRRSLELIRDRSTLNVRILTRSPLARADFDLFRSFGTRLVFGMSLPTLRNDLAKVYEPKAPAPSQRLATLHAAKQAGLHVYVAMAPTYPECDEADLRATLKAVAELDPITIFHEPINIRAENVARIEKHARALGLFTPSSSDGRAAVPRRPNIPPHPKGAMRDQGGAATPPYQVNERQILRTDVFATRESWQDYALTSLHTVSELAKELGIEKRLHLWPDKSLGSQTMASRMPDPRQYLKRLEHWWHRISEWPHENVRSSLKSHGAAELLTLVRWESYPDRILLLGAWHEARGGSIPWRSADMDEVFKQAKQKPPANFPRDIKQAIRSAWVHPVTPRAYTITGTGWRRIGEALQRFQMP